MEERRTRETERRIVDVRWLERGSGGERVSERRRRRSK